MWTTNFRVNTQTFSAYILKLTEELENFFPVQSHIFHNWKTIKLSSAKIVGTSLTLIAIVLLVETRPQVATPLHQWLVINRHKNSAQFRGFFRKIDRNSDVELLIL